MSEIKERCLANVPLERAPDYLQRYIRDIEADAAGQIVLSVRLPLERLGIERRIEISKAVSVHFDAAADAASQPRRMRAISWEPADGGPYPHFTGAIGIRPSGGSDGCWITIEGQYDPPLGLIGDAFDALVGKHIARVTARNLLDEIAIAMEMAYAMDASAPART